MKKNVKMTKKMEEKKKKIDFFSISLHHFFIPNIEINCNFSVVLRTNFVFLIFGTKIGSQKIIGGGNFCKQKIEIF